jgi:hypothetical protein
MGYVMRQGRRIKVATVNPDPDPGSNPRKRRRPFEPMWVKLPRHWITGLKRSKSAHTYELAHLILWEAFKDKRGTGEVILSTEVTGMSRVTKRRAAEELVELGLIRLKKEGTRALRVRVIPYRDSYGEPRKQDKKE